MIPVVESCAPCSLPITLFLRFFLPAGVSYSGGSSSMIKKVSIALSHCSISAEDCSKISVFTFFLAIILQQTTVFPNAVAAWSIPVSCFNMASAAKSWGSFNCPSNVARISFPGQRSSQIWFTIPALSHLAVTSSNRPLGILIYPPSSLPRYMYLEFEKLEIPIARFL